MQMETISAWKHPSYESWASMMKRCYNPKSNRYARYGARGIVVHSSWHDFKNFLRDMGSRPDGASIERIDNDGPYCPENCRWATAKEQALNRSSNVVVERDGISKPLSAWCEELGVDPRRVRARIRLGWDVNRALTEPLLVEPVEIEAFGQKKTRSQWAKETGIPAISIESRIRRGWSVEEALTRKPAMKRSGKPGAAG